MWFETHAHLSDPKFDEDRDDVIQRAFDNGVVGIIEIADGPDEWEKARVLAERYPQKIWWAAGIHPYYADQGHDRHIQSLRELTKHPQFVAIGEIGLDYAKCPIPPDVQKGTFQKLIVLAQETNKPVIIHCRDAYSDLHPILDSHYSPNFDKTPGVVHCFSGNLADAKKIQNYGFKMGLDGPLTYPKSDNLKKIVQALDTRNFVLETDSPYLPPQTKRGKRNEPSLISEIGQKFCDLKSMDVNVLQNILIESSRQLFRLA